METRLLLNNGTEVDLGVFHGMKQFEPFGLDAENECLWQKGTQIPLPPKPFAVLRYLVEHPGRLITHDELLEALWPETYVQPQVLRTYMLDLRKALGDDAREPRFIQTVPKRGFRFIAPVTDGTGQAQPQVERRSAIQSIQIVAPVAVVSSIVNRDAEMASLKAQFALAAGGQRQVVFVTGEPGIGKTALVDAFCDQAPATTARGQCVEGFAVKEEYYPFTEALRQVCASSQGDEACRALARMAPAWLACLGHESPGQSHAQAEAQAEGRERMPGDLCAALEELAAERPLMLIFEDLQWADDATLHLISALARRRGPAKLMLIATYRPQDATAENPLRGLKQDLRMRRLCTEIALEPLARAAVRDLVSRELHIDSKSGATAEELPKGLAAFVHRRSEGNPLFVIAILEHLMAEGHLVREARDGSARWIQTATEEEMEAGLPDGLAQMIELEIARLGPQEQRMLEAGALMNIAFPAWAVAAALEMDPAETEDACQELARRLYFVQAAGQDELPDGTRSTFYVFTHGLYREVLWRKQAEARRARRHVRIAEHLATLFAGREGNVASEMAVHYEAAGEWPRAVNALRSAARHAQERRASTEAVELLERALRLAENLRESDRNTAADAICGQLAEVREFLSLPLEAV